MAFEIFNEGHEIEEDGSALGDTHIHLRCLSFSHRLFLPLTNCYHFKGTM